MTNASRPCMGISNRRSQSEAVYFSLFQGSRSASSLTTAAKSSGLYDLMVAGEGSMVRRNVAPIKQRGDGHRLKTPFQQFLRQVFYHVAGVQALAVGVEEGHGQKRLDLGLVRRDPPAGQKERGRNAALHEHVNQGSVVPGSPAHRTHVEGQGHSLATRRAGSDDLSHTVG